jgi:hypothetical protein
MKTRLSLTVLAAAVATATSLGMPERIAGEQCPGLRTGGFVSPDAEHGRDGADGREGLCPSDDRDRITSSRTPEDSPEDDPEDDPEDNMAPGGTVIDLWSPPDFISTVLRIYGDDPAIISRGNPRLLSI